MRKFGRGFLYAFKGLSIALKEERNFRIDILCGMLVLLLSWWVHLSITEWTIIILTIGFVLAAEVFNTALEELCDKFEPTQDPHIAKIKDLAAAAVLTSAIAALCIGLVIFIPKFW